MRTEQVRFSVTFFLMGVLLIFTPSITACQPKSVKDIIKTIWHGNQSSQKENNHSHPRKKIETKSTTIDIYSQKKAKDMDRNEQETKSIVLALSGLLSHSDWNVAEKVVEALAKIKTRQAFMLLAKAVSNSQTSGKAIDVLSKMGAEATPAIPTLVESLAKLQETLQDSSHQIVGIATVLDSLKAHASPAIPVLMMILQKAAHILHGSDRMYRYSVARVIFDVRDAVIKALSSIGKNSIPIIENLLLKNSKIGHPCGTEHIPSKKEEIFYCSPSVYSTYRDPNAINVMYVKILGNIGKDAIPTLTKSLLHCSAAVRFMAAVTLAYLGKEETASLSILRKSLHSNYRNKSVIEAFIRLGRGKEVISVMESDLYDKDWVIREYAVNIFVKMRKDAVPVLSKALSHKSIAVSSDAAKALGQIGADAKEAIPALIKALVRKDTGAFAAKALGQIGADAKEAIPALIKALSHRDKRVREVSSTALWKLGKKAKLAIPALCHSLFRDDWNSENAIKALAEMGKEATASIPCLIKVLIQFGQRQNYVGFQVANVISKIGKDAVPALIKIIPHASFKVRYAAIIALGNIGRDAKAAIPVLTKALFDRKLHASEQIILFLGKMGKEALPALTKALTHSDARTRMLAAETLGAMGKDAKPAVFALIKALSDKDTYVRSHVIQALGNIGKDAEAAAPAIKNFFSSSIVNEIQDAVRALKKIGKSTKEIIPTLVTNLSSLNDDVFRITVETLLLIKEDKKKSISALISVCFGTKTKEQSKLDILEKAITTSAERCKMAISALGKMGKTAVPALIKAFAHADNTVRAQAVWELRTHGKETFSLLVKALSDLSKDVRASAARALGHRGKNAKTAVSALIKALADSDSQVQSNVIEALGHIAQDIQRPVAPHNVSR